MTNIFDLLKPEVAAAATQIANGTVVLPVTAEDGTVTYQYVQTGMKSAKPRKTTDKATGEVTETPAFDLDAAVAKYQESLAKAAERAAKPKAAKVKEDTPEDVALMDNIVSMLNHDNPLTAQEIAPMIDSELSWQKVSAMCKRLTARGKTNKVDKDGKAGYVLA